MFRIIFATTTLLLLGDTRLPRADAPSTRPVDPPSTRPSPIAALPRLDQLESPGPLGFAVYCIGMEDGPDHANDLEAFEGLQFAYLYGVDRKLIGKVRRGDVLPKPFQDWRVVGIPLVGKRPSIVIANIKTKEIVELQQAQRLPTTRRVRVH